MAPCEIRDSRLPVETRRTPAAASWATLGPPGRINTFTGTETALTTVRDLIEIDEAGGVDHVGAGSDVGLQPGDRVIEIVDPVQEVLATRRQDQPGCSRAGRCRADALHSDVERIDRLGQRVPVLDRAPRRAGGSQQLDALVDSDQVVGEAPLGVDVQRQIGRRRQRPDVRQQLVAAHGHVEASERRREPGAGRGECGEAERSQQASRAEVVRIGHHEGVVGVQRTESVDGR